MAVGTIIDIALIALAVILLLVGAVKGFNKQITKLLGSFGALIAGLVLSYFLTGVLVKIEFIGNLGGTFSGIFSGIEGASTEVTTLDELKTALESGPLLIFTFLAETMFGAMQALNLTTVAAYFGYLMLFAIVYLVCFIIIFIVVKLLFKLLRKLFAEINKLLVFKIIDKVLGAVWSVALFYVIVIGILYSAVVIVFAKWIPNVQEGFYAVVETSKILSWLHSTNLIGNLLANSLFQINIPSLPYTATATESTLLLLAGAAA